MKNKRPIKQKNSALSTTVKYISSGNGLLLLILLIAVFFRFYHFPLRYGFDYDALRDGLLTRFAATHFQFPLLGPPTSVGNFTFGPWYYYLLIISELILRTIYSPWISIGIISLVQVMLFYKIGEELENKILGVVNGLLVAVSSSQIILSTGLSNPNVVPVCTTAALFLFLKILKSKKENSNPLHIFLLGLILGVGLFSHYQMIGVFILIPLLIFQQRKSIVRICIYLFLGLAVSFLPLFLFDLSHGFTTIGAMTHYFLHGTVNPIYVPNSWKLYLFKFWPAFFTSTIGLPFIVGILLLLFTSAMIISSLYRRCLPRSVILILLAFLFNIILFRYFKGERVIYYEYFLQPFIFFFVGYTLNFMIRVKRPIGVSLLLCLLFIMIITSMHELSPKQSHIDSERLSTTLLQIDSSHTMTVYTCKSVEKYEAYSLALTIEEHKKTGPGRKIGIEAKACDVMPVSLITEDYINGITERIVDLSHVPDSLLRAKGWIPVTPKTIYYSLLYSNTLNPFAYPELHTR